MENFKRASILNHHIRKQTFGKDEMYLIQQQSMPMIIIFAFREPGLYKTSEENNMTG